MSCAIASRSSIAGGGWRATARPRCGGRCRVANTARWRCAARTAATPTWAGSPACRRCGGRRTRSAAPEPSSSACRRARRWSPCSTGSRRRARRSKASRPARPRSKTRSSRSWGAASTMQRGRSDRAWRRGVSAGLPAAAAGAAGPRARRTFLDDLALNLRATYARTYVRVVGSLREPSWVISDAVFPNLGMCAFVLLYRALGAPREYEALAVIGGVLSTYWINVLWGMGAQLYWEKQQGQLQLYFVAPCSRMTILTGMALGGALMTTLRSVAGIALGFF